MTYIIKKNEPLVNLKLTDSGRRNLSSGNLNFTTFSLGDGEMDYSNDNPNRINILRPVDRQHDIQYAVPSQGSVTKQPISLINSINNEISSPVKERGLYNFIENTQTYELDSSLWLIGNLFGVTHTTEDEITLSGTNKTIINNYRDRIKSGDFLLLKFKTTGYTESYVDTTNPNGISNNPIPYLLYQINKIDNQDEFILTTSGTTSGTTTGTTTGTTSGTTSGTTTGFTGNFTLRLDRDLPNFSDYIVDAFIYPGKYTIKDYYDKDTPIAYWSGGLLDFSSNCTLSNDDVPIWNMNIVTIEDVIGLDGTIYKDKLLNESRNYWGTLINYDYFLNEGGDKVGLIHYTNNSVSNYYGEGFYRDTFKLILPHIMWHKKQFNGVGLGNQIGYTFICDNELKLTGEGNDIRYYDLIDQEEKKTAVGKVLIDQKIIFIEDKELLMAMSYKSNRNWTLPTPKLTLTEPGVCIGSSFSGALNLEEVMHISYLFNDDLGITGVHCENYATIINESNSVKDVIFEFPKDPNNPNYSEFGYLKNYTDIDGYGYRAGGISMLWQKTSRFEKPDPSDWNILNISNFVGGTGCLSTALSTNERFELHSETTISPMSIISNKYTLIKKEIGEVIVSLNGIILKQASSIANLGVDGDYFKIKNNGSNSVIEFSPSLLFSGDILQFHYLVGESTAASTIRQDINVPTGGVPIGNDYTDGIYLIGSTVALTLERQPNNGVVYLFYNGQLISSNNYGVIPTGSIEDRRVELNFIPADASRLSLFYLDNSGFGSNPIATSLSSENIQNLRVNIDSSLLALSDETKYDLNDFISLPSISNIIEHTFGDETFFFGNVSTDVKATIYKSLITCNVLPNTFIATFNPTFNPNRDKVAFTEMGIYDSDDDLVAIGKFSEPLTRKLNSDVLIIQATIDF